MGAVRSFFSVTPSLLAPAIAASCSPLTRFEIRSSEFPYIAQADTNAVIAHLVQVPRDWFPSEGIISPLLQATYRILAFRVRTPIRVVDVYMSRKHVNTWSIVGVVDRRGSKVKPFFASFNSNLVVLTIRSDA